MDEFHLASSHLSTSPRDATNVKSSATTQGKPPASSVTPVRGVSSDSTSSESSDDTPAEQYPLCGSEFLTELRGHSRAQSITFPLSTSTSTGTPVSVRPSSQMYWSAHEHLTDSDGGGAPTPEKVAATTTPPPIVTAMADSPSSGSTSSSIDPLLESPRTPVSRLNLSYGGESITYSNPFSPGEVEATPTSPFRAPARDRAASAASLMSAMAANTSSGRRFSTSSFPPPGGWHMPHEVAAGSSNNTLPACPSLTSAPACSPFSPLNRMRHLHAPKAVNRGAEANLQRMGGGGEEDTLRGNHALGSPLTRRISGHIKNLAAQRATSWNEFAFAYSQGWFDPLRTPMFPESSEFEHLPAPAPSTPRLAAVDREDPILRAQSAPPSPLPPGSDPEDEAEDDDNGQPDDMQQASSSARPAKPSRLGQTHTRSFSIDHALPPPPARRPQFLKLGHFPNVRHLHDVRPFYERHKFLPAPLPQQEPERLKTLMSFNILYTTDDLNFDRVVHMIKLVFNASMAFCSLPDGEGFKSYSGLGYTVDELRRSVGFCPHVVLLNGDDPFVVLDTHKDWRFKNNPLVTGNPNIRFYAGAPLRTSDGYNLGALAVADTKPRTKFSPRCRHILKEFAAIVIRELELWRDRLQLRVRDRIQTSLEEFTRECLETKDRLLLCQQDVDLHLLQVYRRASEMVKNTLDLDGCTILDIGQFERVELHAPEDGTTKVVYRANPYIGGSGNSFSGDMTDDFGPLPAFPVLASTSREARTHKLKGWEHKLVSEFLADYRFGRIFHVAPPWIRSVYPSTLRYALVVPIFGIDHQPFALICAHTQDKGRQFLQGSELQFLRGIGSTILSAVLRRRTFLADRSKNVLISSVSHELRTPLHGMLAAGELLSDTTLDPTQEAFLATLRTCGQQLIETVNHVLDFAKLSIEGKDNSTSQIQCRQVNLAELIHSTVEGCWLGQRARSMQMTSDGESDLGTFYSPEPRGLIPGARRLDIHQDLSNVESVLDIGFREKGWNVVCEVGGLRRIIMNLFNNSLKFTKEGYVQIMLRELPHPADQKRIPLELRVIDTGKGIGKEFLKSKMFQPFAQENPMQPGTGLGLAIVGNIVTSSAMGGTLDVYSAENVGTEIRIQFQVDTVDEDENGVPIKPVNTRLGVCHTMAFVNYLSHFRGHQLQKEVMTNYARCLGFTVIDNPAEADILVINEAAGLTDEVREMARTRPILLIISFKIHDTQTLQDMGRMDAYTGILYKPMGIDHFTRGLHGAVRWLKDPSNPDLLGALSQINTAERRRGSLEDPSKDASTKMMQILGHRPRTHLTEMSPSPSPTPSPAAQQQPPPDFNDSRPMLTLTHNSFSSLGSQQQSKPSSSFLNYSFPPRPPTIRTFSAPSNPTVVQGACSGETTPSTQTTPVTPLAAVTKPEWPERPPTVRHTHTASISGFSTVSIADGGVMLASCQPANPLLTVPLRQIRPPRIMVVEDNPINRRVLTALLKKRGFQYTEAVDGCAGVELFEKSPPNYWDIETRRRLDGDVYTSPNISPTSTHVPLSPISSSSQLPEPQTHHTKIFALTGLATVDDKRKAFASGVDGYLFKPVSLVTLDLVFKKIGF
ncbi:two-component sensor molecule [Trichosporon asahii var. asahii CBS 2479]|uniref:histidine kinase n=1 Tax=Trichosporon asahii var. asahii (strain ATCC 90039 / CBS 2479 / JCM 2466 / KCTC 7840 / NBRC 103889/ NCYC 2677 / UAMH 7654) TaxID=1186058 RepID=J4U8U6_TRIAS|nr:two-component sensor molecule [Trichosporon asahii var. asahii CBS 2479]EJT46955.1 two-component sensor molecule [Trichosporon asahii var. asahii CBS 2479]